MGFYQISMLLGRHLNTTYIHTFTHTHTHLWLIEVKVIYIIYIMYFSTLVL